MLILAVATSWNLAMVHGYHVIMPMYGFWLPNDPRGSWSDFVRRWELARIGKATASHERMPLRSLSQDELRRREIARSKLMYPPVKLNGDQALAIGQGFATQSAKCHYTIWACSILPEHTHLVVARHSYSIEQIVNLLKGASTRTLVEKGQHPFSKFAAANCRPPRIWSAQCWKIYLNCEQAIEDAVHYVEKNPKKEGKPEQSWSFVKRFSGISKGGWTTYH